VIQVIDEKAFLSILENDAHHAEPSLHDGVALFNDFASPPLKVPEMGNPVTGSQEKARFHHSYYTSMFSV